MAGGLLAAKVLFFRAGQSGVIVTTPSCLPQIHYHDFRTLPGYQATKVFGSANFDSGIWGRCRGRLPRQDVGSKDAPASKKETPDRRRLARGEID